MSCQSLVHLNKKVSHETEVKDITSFKWYINAVDEKRPFLEGDCPPHRDLTPYRPKGSPFVLF